MQAAVDMTSSVRTPMPPLLRVLRAERGPAAAVPPASCASDRTRGPGASLPHPSPCGLRPYAPLHPHLPPPLLPCLWPRHPSHAAARPAPRTTRPPAWQAAWPAAATCLRRHSAPTSRMGPSPGSTATTPQRQAGPRRQQAAQVWHGRGARKQLSIFHCLLPDTRHVMTPA